MFVDKAKIQLKAGDGGNGVVAFRREKYVPHGGPSGGDGGKGGDIIFKVDEGLKTLLDFKSKKHLKAKRGEHGSGSNKHGKNGENLVVNVPPGTIIKDDEGSIICDLVEPGDEFTVAAGGRGGRGNAKFKTPKNRAPRMAEKGEPGEEKIVTLELKLIADVGLVGFPNVGKSTLLSIVSAAEPKIADYPFTTLTPNLGVCETSDGYSFVAADIPGIIEGAYSGKGLGHEFLKHIERTKLLVHIIDMSGFERNNPIKDYESLNDELYNYSERLAEKPQIVVGNKMDIGEIAEANLAKFRKTYNVEVWPISCVTKAGISDLIDKIGNEIKKLPVELKDEEKELEEQVGTRGLQQGHTESTDEIEVLKVEESLFVVKNKKLEKLASMTDFENEEAFDKFQRTIEKIGVEKELIEKGIQEGDMVKIGKVEFEYYE